MGQLEEFVRKQNGRFVTGKFDQYKRNVPYLALIQAFQQLIGQLLSGTKDELEAWRSRILDCSSATTPRSSSTSFPNWS